MQLDVFWTNKIPESNGTDELILVATILNEFDGLEFKRSELTDRFSTISNRLPDARDSSDYRDQYGAYVSYLGLMQYEKSGNSWICRMNPKAKELLCGVLPDPQAYVRFQM
jgi:hypothetical protein